MFTLLYLKYWCESDEEKNEIKQILLENEKSVEKKRFEKYNPNYIFNKKSEKIKNHDENTEKHLAVIKEENIFQKIIRFFKNIKNRR